MTPEANRNNVANPIIFTDGDILNPAGPPGTFLSFALRPSRPLRPCCRRHRQVAAIHCRGAAQRLDEGRGGWLRRTWPRHSKDSTHTELWQRKVYQNVASCSQAQDFPCDAFSKHKASIWDRIGRAVRADRCGKLMEKVRINWIEESYVVSPATRVSERFHRRFVLPTLWFQWIWPTKVI
jgi:hypothetical protein